MSFSPMEARKEQLRLKHLSEVLRFEPLEVVHVPGYQSMGVVYECDNDRPIMARVMSVALVRLRGAITCVGVRFVERHPGKVGPKTRALRKSIRKLRRQVYGSE